MSLLLGILITFFVNFIAMNGYYKAKKNKLEVKAKEEIKNQEDQ